MSPCRCGCSGSRRGIPGSRISINIMHGIETTRDFQVGLSRAWHGLTEVVEVVTADNFPRIERAPLTYTVGEQLREWPGMTVPISLDDGLPVGTVSGESYTLFTPREAMAFLAEVLAGTGHKVESLGMVFNRAHWFVTFSLDELAGIAPDGEAFKLSASGGLDKSQSPRINLTHTVQVCHNTVMLTRSGRALFGSKLTKGFSSRLEASRDALGETVGMARIWNETLRTLERTKASADEARAVYASDLVENGADLRSARSSNLLDELVVGFQRGRGNSGATRYDTLNGVHRGVRFWSRGFLVQARFIQAVGVERVRGQRPAQGVLRGWYRGTRMGSHGPDRKRRTGGRTAQHRDGRMILILLVLVLLFYSLSD